MCFQLEDYKQRAKTAKKDIKCWKVVYANNKAVYQSHFVYKMNVVQPPVKLRKSGYDEIEEGYHSYTNFEVAKRRYLFLTHSSGERRKFKIIPCVIPKGTKYYENTWDKEYVSSSIKRIRTPKKITHHVLHSNK